MDRWGIPRAQNKLPHSLLLSLRPGFLGTELGVGLDSQPLQPPPEGLCVIRDDVSEWVPLGGIMGRACLSMGTLSHPAPHPLKLCTSVCVQGRMHTLG